MFMKIKPIRRIIQLNCLTWICVVALRSHKLHTLHLTELKKFLQRKKVHKNSSCSYSDYLDVENPKWKVLLLLVLLVLFKLGDDHSNIYLLADTSKYMFSCHMHHVWLILIFHFVDGAFFLDSMPRWRWFSMMMMMMVHFSGLKHFMLYCVDVLCWLKQASIRVNNIFNNTTPTLDFVCCMRIIYIHFTATICFGGSENALSIFDDWKLRFFSLSMQ